MIRRLTTGAAIAVLVFAFHATAEGKPKAMVTEPTKDFEVVPKGELIKHSFTIVNEGDAPLQLMSVKPACGCTVAKYHKKIAPGKSGQIEATVDTADFHGPISKSITVVTNDPDNPKLQLVVKAKVKPYIGLDPGYARYNYVQGEYIEPITQLLWAEDGSPVKILDLKSPHSYMQVSQREARDDERNGDFDGQQWAIDIVLDKDSPVGALRQYVEVTLDHPKQKIVKIPVSGFVRPRQHVTPTEVKLGSLDSANLPLRKTLAFTNFITDEIELTKVETGNQAVTAEVKQVSETGHRFQVRLTIESGMPKGEFSGTVKIHTTDTKNPVVEVPISGTIL